MPIAANARPDCFMKQRKVGARPARGWLPLDLVLERGEDLDLDEVLGTATGALHADQVVDARYLHAEPPPQLLRNRVSEKGALGSGSDGTNGPS